MSNHMTLRSANRSQAMLSVSRSVVNTHVALGYLFSSSGSRPKSIICNYVLFGSVPRPRPSFDLGRFFEASVDTPGTFWGATKVVLGSFSFWVVGYLNPTGPVNSVLRCEDGTQIFCGELVIFQAGARVSCLKRPSLPSSSGILANVAITFMNYLQQSAAKGREIQSLITLPRLMLSAD